ncbi:hypothetical protein F3Y22_tig00004041pilonHSYRG00049 [Hibiscus syriacus]|uniref:Uncharacterized protein n=1 Tax=Hibiscus syriacus TaxID=106335 RepID=A0A6A3CIF8_HIBSY|nr:hypothetical protein F3Y22_tig00004041pilonHSYRG00049 [Hibiscus syriacus]
MCRRFCLMSPIKRLRDLRRSFLLPPKEALELHRHSGESRDGGVSENEKDSEREKSRKTTQSSNLDVHAMISRLEHHYPVEAGLIML